MHSSAYVTTGSRGTSDYIEINNRHNRMQKLSNYFFSSFKKTNAIQVETDLNDPNNNKNTYNSNFSRPTVQPHTAAPASRRLSKLNNRKVESYGSRKTDSTKVSSSSSPGVGRNNREIIPINDTSPKRNSVEGVGNRRSQGKNTTYESSQKNSSSSSSVRSDGTNSKGSRTSSKGSAVLVSNPSNTGVREKSGVGSNKETSGFKAGNESSNVSNSSAKKKLCCDKCDGAHETENCPYYKKQRDKHPDAQKNGKQIGGASLLPGSFLRNARVVRQPGDGSCLFHSLSFGLRQYPGHGSTNATRLRSEICQFIMHHPNTKISDTPLKDWVKWDSSLSVSDYARRMARGSWGGGIEMACVSILKECSVHVYERYGSGHKRISAFDHPQDPSRKPVIRVLYCGGVHYDAIVER